MERIGVVIPVHNEEHLLPALLSTVLGAAARSCAQVRIVVVLDACTDGSRRCVEALSDDLPRRVSIEAVEIGERQVGAARRAGAARLLDGQDLLDAQHGSSLWIANTDADCRVPRDWLARQLAYARQGADAVVGTVAVEDWSPRPRSVRIAAERAYRSGPHRHVHGANLGVRADAYQRAGGFPVAAAHEDVLLVGRLHQIGASMTWATDLPVLTSARRAGRAPSGFAAYLDRLEHGIALGAEPTR